MTVRAKTDRSFYLRFVLIGAAACGFALWCLYDGAVKYPAQNERVLKHEQLNDDGLGNEWHKFARDRGWPLDPGELKDDAEIVVQYIMAGMAASVGLAFFVVVLRSRGRWIEATQSRLTSSWGQSVDFNRIVSLDKKKWKEKGIARITYEDGRRKRRFVLDNYKYDRQLTTTILTQIEAKIGADKIVGGPLEPPPWADWPRRLQTDPRKVGRPRLTPRGVAKRRQTLPVYIAGPKPSPNRWYPVATTCVATACDRQMVAHAAAGRRFWASPPRPPSSPVSSAELVCPA